MLNYEHSYPHIRARILKRLPLGSKVMVARAEKFGIATVLDIAVLPNDILVSVQFDKSGLYQIPGLHMVYPLQSDDPGKE